ncbi:MAG: C4-type zinc ribbon domain-containing protein, partial [Planctomycetota bacterium]
SCSAAMGPTNKALLKLFRVDTDLRQAQADLDAATRGVRVQQKRADLAAAARDETDNKLKHAKAQQMELDSDIKSREAHVEHLRDQQKAAQNNKQFQAFLIEINNANAEKQAIEEQSVAKLTEIDELAKQLEEQTTAADFEQRRATELQEQIGGKTADLEARIAELQPKRDAAADEVPAKALATFERIADNYDGEAMAPVGHIDGKQERYYCTACNMELVADVYNRLMTRDEVLLCPGCGRILFIPEDLTPEMAVRKKAVKKTRKKATKKAAKKTAKKTKSGIPAAVKNIVTTAQAESLRQAEADEVEPAECEVQVEGQSEPIGPLRVRDVESFRKLINGKAQGEDLELKLTVVDLSTKGDAPADADTAEQVTPPATETQPDADAGVAGEPAASVSDQVPTQPTVETPAS